VELFIFILGVSIAYVLGLVTSMVFRCKHKYGMWSEWTDKSLSWSHTKFVRYTACIKCGHLKESEIDKHYCTLDKCPHLKDFKQAFSHVSRIQELEKELGI